MTYIKGRSWPNKFDHATQVIPPVAPPPFLKTRAVQVGSDRREKADIFKWVSGFYGTPTYNPRNDPGVYVRQKSKIPCNGLPRRDIQGNGFVLPFFIWGPLIL